MTNPPRITEAAIRAKVTENPMTAASITTLLVWSREQPGAVTGYLQRCRAASSTPTRSASPSLMATTSPHPAPAPYDWEGYCKHIVATMLTFIQDDGPIPITRHR